MKFRQFEFRLFPKMKSKKKKKPKLGHADFPRDISLDKNSNFCNSEYPQFYDNLGVDANYQEHFPAEIFYKQEYDSVNFLSCHNAFYSCCDLKKSSLPELEINVGGSTCSCDNCACVVDTFPSMTRSCTLGGFNCEPVGTPNTIQRTRTRIKTNPWVPSPRTTPSPSPTDHYQPGSPWCKGDNCSDIPVTRPSDLPLQTNHSIPEFSGQSGEMMAQETLTTDECYYTINNLHRDDDVNIFELDETDNGQDKVVEPYVMDDRKQNDEYSSSDYSNSPSPVVEFLSCVKYEINFDYENTADDLLDTVSNSRHDSFSNGNTNTDVFDMEENNVQTVDENDLNYVADITEINNLNVDSSDAENNEVTFDETCNNMQESIDTGYASVSRDSECTSRDSEYTSSDEADDELSAEFEGIKQTNESRNRTNEGKHSSTNLHYEDATFHDVSGDDVDVKHRDDLNLNAVEHIASARVYDVTSDVEHISDLEWDNEPTAQTLLLDFPMNEDISRCSIHAFPDKNQLPVSSVQNGSQYHRIRNYGSVEYRKNQVKIADKACIGSRRRSRSLADIELSLQDKVTLLREEKTFVQRKIREAIVEDRIRDHQLKIFRLLSGDQRKQLIMKTLYDLKSRLEDQSARLQSSYSTVLSLKRMFSQRRTSESPVQFDQQLIHTDE